MRFLLFALLFALAAPVAEACCKTCTCPTVSPIVVARPPQALPVNLLGPVWRMPGR